MRLFNKATGRKSWWRRFREYADNCVISGFIPNEHAGFQRFGRRVAALWAWIQVGKITVVGAENLKAAEHLIYCPNHSAMLDAIVMYPIMPEGVRYMAAVEEMRGLWGIKAILMGAMGAFPVDRKNGRSVIPAAVGLVKSGKRLCMFPEGKISPSGTYLEFKKGAAWIAIGACDALGHTAKVGIVPIHICYHTRDVDSATDFTKMKLRWRHGVTITVGEPVYVHDVVPMTPDAVIGRIRDSITSNSCATTSLPEDTSKKGA